MKGCKIMKVGFVSLGCSKNLVDTEMVIGLFKKNNFEIVNNPEKAEIIIINTCGFIESAKQEAINTILEMAEYKKKKCKFLIVIADTPYLQHLRRVARRGDRVGRGLEPLGKRGILQDRSVGERRKLHRGIRPRETGLALPAGCHTGLHRR